MYLPLGKFIVPNIEDWVPAVTYQAEPPLAIRGAMNPWALERQRQLYMAEESAWKLIQRYQATFRDVESRMKAAIVLFNIKLQQLEQLTGQKSGIQAISTYGSLIGVVPGFQILGGIFAAVGFIGGMFSNKKKKAQKLTDELTAIHSQLLDYQQQLSDLAQKVNDQVNITTQVKVAQAQVVADTAQQSQTAYETRQSLDAQQAAALRARNAAVALLPKIRQGGRNGL